MKPEQSPAQETVLKSQSAIDQCVHEYRQIVLVCKNFWQDMQRARQDYLQWSKRTDKVQQITKTFEQKKPPVSPSIEETGGQTPKNQQPAFNRCKDWSGKMKSTHLFPKAPHQTSLR